MRPVNIDCTELEHLLPVTLSLLKQTRWSVHPGVLRVVLGGSRGLRGGYRPDSDIDLSLIVDPSLLPGAEPEREQFLRAVIETTLNSWQGSVELDTAAVFGSLTALELFNRSEFDEALVRVYAPEIGLYKLQKGFNGYIPAEVLDYRKIYPLITIWQR